MRWTALTPSTSVFLRCPQKVPFGVRTAHAANSAEVDLFQDIAGMRLAFRKLTCKAQGLQRCLGDDFAVTAKDCFARTGRTIFVFHGVNPEVEFTFVFDDAVFQPADPGAPRQTRVFGGSVTVGASFDHACAVVVIRANHHGGTDALREGVGDTLASFHGAHPRDAHELSSGHVDKAIAERGEGDFGGGHVRVCFG
jgi:hypothetical protein